MRAPSPTQATYAHNGGNVLVATYAPHTTNLVAVKLTLAEADSLYEALALELVRAARHPERGAVEPIAQMVRELRTAMDAAKAWRRAAGWANPFQADEPRAAA